MMSDLIQRLRKHREYQKSKVNHRCNYCGNIPANWHPLICTEAADEIERLEGELSKATAFNRSKALDELAELDADFIGNEDVLGGDLNGKRK